MIGNGPDDWYLAPCRQGKPAALRPPDLNSGVQSMKRIAAVSIAAALAVAGFAPAAQAGILSPSEDCAAKIFFIPLC